MSAAMRYVRDAIERRKRPLIIASSVIGSVYALSSWGIATLKEAQSRMGDDRRDRENLRRRFAQNQDDVAFTVLALLPTLADQLWSEMDVEGLTKQLQKTRAPPPSAPVAVEAPSAPAPVPVSDTHAEEKSEAEEALGYSLIEAQENEVGQTATATNGEAQEQLQAQAVPAATKNAASVAAVAHPGDRPTTGSEHFEAAQEVADPTQAATAKTVAEVVDAQAVTAPAVDQSVQLANGDAAAPAVKAASALIEPSNAADLAGGLLPSSEAHASTRTASPSALSPKLDAEAFTPNGTPLSEGEWLRKPIARTGSSLDAISEPPPPPIASTARLSPVPAPVKVFVTPKVEKQDEEKQVADEGIKVDEKQSETKLAEVHLTEEERQEALLLDKKAKLELWNELKVVAFSRTITSLYALVLLTLQTSIQLNMLGRRSYVDSVSALFPVAAPTLDDEPHRIKLEPGGAGTGAFGLGPAEEDEDEQTRQLAEHERLFLTFSWYFLHRGWAHLAHEVRAAVKEVFASVPLKTPITHAEFMRLVGEVRRRVEYEEGGEMVEKREEESLSGTRSERSTFSTRRGKRRNFLSALFAADHKAEIQVLVSAGAWSSPSSPLPAQVRRLLDETKDLIDSRDFRRVLALSLDRVFGVLDEALRPTFGVPNAPPPGLVTSLETPGGRFRELGENDEEEDWYAGKRVRLANLFPVMAKQSTLVVHGVPNVYAESMSEIKELKAFTAIIYTAWNS